LAFSIALAFEDDLVGIVGEAVDGTLREDRIIEERNPFVDRAIRGEDGGGAAVPFEDDFVEVVRLGGVEPPKAEVVNDEDLGREEAPEDFVGRVIRTRLLEMLEEMGYCTGIENYSRHLDGRKPGDPPSVLIDHFPEDYLLFIDESHVSIPQIQGMYRGDRSRKETLVDYGFRLPSALDNRPLTFEEFNSRLKQVIYVSATPADYELKMCGRKVIEQVIRPTGLMDPAIEVKPATHQVDDLLEEIRTRTKRKERVLVTTLTKRMAEDLTEYYSDLGVKAKYLHSDIATLERIEIVRNLRLGTFDVLIGVNLLREGLDLPEVSLVAILDADKEGFLRSAQALIQTCGRAARNLNGTVIMYGDLVTNSMKTSLKETNRRRKIQFEYNRKNNITPEAIKKDIRNVLASIYEADYLTVPSVAEPKKEYRAIKNIPKEIEKLKKQMREAAQQLEFERAAELRDRIKKLEEMEISLG